MASVPASLPYGVRVDIDLTGLSYFEYENMLGKQLFGKPGRMLLGLWICRLIPEEAKDFWGSQYSDWCIKTKRSYPQPGPDLDRFERMGMIETINKQGVGGDRCHRFRRLPHPLWDVWRLLDSILSGLEDPQARRAFVQTPEQVHQMVADLQRIHLRTAPEPVSGNSAPEPVRETRFPETESTVVESKGQKRGWPGNYRPRGLHGELCCTRCKQWKAPEHFSPRPNRPGLYKSQCKACMAEQHRVRYLGMKKVEALNAVGLTFMVSEEDDVTGLACTDCGKPIEPGQQVAGHTRLWHTACLQT